MSSNEIFALYGWDEHDDVQVRIATFVQSTEVTDPFVRANEVMRRMTRQGVYESAWIETVPVNPSNDDLGLKPMLHEVKKNDFTDVAYTELFEKGEVWVPLWMNPGWLVNELRFRYGIGIDYVGRKITLISPDEIERRKSIVVETEENAGFTETP